MEAAIPFTNACMYARADRMADTMDKPSDTLPPSLLIRMLMVSTPPSIAAMSNATWLPGMSCPMTP